MGIFDSFKTKQKPKNSQPNLDKKLQNEINITKEFMSTLKICQKNKTPVYNIEKLPYPKERIINAFMYVFKDFAEKGQGETEVVHYLKSICLGLAHFQNIYANDALTILDLITEERKELEKRIEILFNK